MRDQRHEQLEGDSFQLLPFFIRGLITLTSVAGQHEYGVVVGPGEDDQQDRPGRGDIDEVKAAQGLRLVTLRQDECMG